MQMSLLLLPLLSLLRAWITDVELRKHVTRRQRHDLQVCGVPRTQNNATIVRCIAQLVNHLRQLVHALPSVIRLGVYVLSTEVPPLESVDRAEVTLRALCEPNAIEVAARAVAVPDLDAGFGEGEGGGGAADEPEELGEDGAEKDALGCEEWENGGAAGRGEGKF